MSETSKSFEKDQVVKIINSVLDKVENKSEISTEAIYEELSSLKKVIDDARAELGASRAGDIQGEFIPTATDELDAVVEATAEATSGIMDACEAIQKTGADIGAPHQEAIETDVTKIYEACTFQDITGQRITKVIKTLKQIDEKVSALLGVMGEALPEGKAEEISEDESLMNGPQMKGQGVSQEEIDKMLEDLF